jgi:HK97 family phage major capsid protein
MARHAGSDQVTEALRKTGEAREGARRFKGAAFRDQDPDYCFADWLLCVARAKSQGRLHDPAGARRKLADVYKSETGVEKAALSAGGSGTTGGYTVPAALRDDLMRDVSEESFVRPGALVVPMTTATLDLPYPDVLTATGTAGMPPFFGGIQMNWQAEATSLQETAEPKFRQVQLRANELSGYALVSNPMMQDALGLDAWLRRLFARSVAWFEDYAFIRGTGVGQPLGVLNSGSALAVSRGTPTAIKLADLAAMLSDLLPHSYMHAVWLLSVTGMVQLVQLTGWGPNYPPSAVEDGDRSVGALFSRPLYVTEKLPVLGTKGDCILFDPSLYVIGDRQALEVDVSEHVNFLTNRATWRVLERVDGRPIFDQTIKLSDQATTVSPVVVLN